MKVGTRLNPSTNWRVRRCELTLPLVDLDGATWVELVSAVATDTSLIWLLDGSAMN